MSKLATIKSQKKRDFRLSIGSTTPQDFNIMKVGNKTLRDDVALDTNFWERANLRQATVENVERAIERQNVAELRTYSNTFFNKSGIYSRLCRYMSYLFRYDTFITPHLYDQNIKSEKVIEGWYKSASYLEMCGLKKVFGEIALKVIKNGCYYGYTMTQKGAAYLQELPPNYCRSRYKLNGKSAIEFNIKYFDDTFSDADYRVRVLKMFPKEFQKAYISYHNGKLTQDFQGDDRGWFLLDTAYAVKFDLSNGDIPLFASVIPQILHLEEAKDLDRKKMLQQILKIIIQQIPIDKNGELIFDTQEAQQLHNNAVGMLSNAIGVDVLTTFADIQVADTSDKGNVSSVDQLNKVERTVYNEAGVSQMQFNTDGNLALEKSIANDEATMSNLVLQFEEYANSLLTAFNKNPKRLRYSVQILPTTIYNFRDLAKLYKEQTMIGFSKLLPQVALGHTQSSVIATAYFENEILSLGDLFIPPQMSSTISADSGDAGRPELADDEKSEKTILNKESEV